MWRTDSWVVPRLSGRPFLEQPPLYYWAQAGLFALLQRSDAGLARLPSALFSLGNLAMCIALGMRFFSRRACFLAGLVLLTLCTFMQRSHWIVVDSALAFGITGSLACFAHGETSRGARRRWWWAGMTACLTIAFLSKGTIGPGLAAVGILTYLIWRRSAREIVPLVMSGALVGLVAAIWLWGHERRGRLLQSARRDVEAASALRQALGLYREWGAGAKVHMLSDEIAALAWNG